jgi:transaldolase
MKLFIDTAISKRLKSAILGSLDGVTTNRLYCQKRKEILKKYVENM